MDVFNYGGHLWHFFLAKEMNFLVFAYYYYKLN